MVLIGVCLIGASVPAQTENKKNCLWEAKTENGTIYFLGSIHVLKKEHYPLSEAFEKAYQKSDVVYFETSIDSLEMPSVAQQIMGKALYSGQGTIKDDLTPETAALFDSVLQAAQLPVQQFSKFKPWFAATVLPIMKMQSVGATPSYGVDKYFFKKARTDEKEVGAFELVAEQIGMLAGLSSTSQDIMLQQMLRSLDEVESMFAKITDAWVKGDEAELVEVLKKDMQEVPDLYATLLVERNKNWCKEIKKLALKKQNTLVIVGAAHLVGKDSVIEMLRKDGFKIKQL